MTWVEAPVWGHPVGPCEDCIDGVCTMNCSGPRLPEPEDHGSCFLTREKDGETITVRARTPGSKIESKVSIPVTIWKRMVAGIE